MKKVFVLVLIIVLATISTVHAAQYMEAKRLNYWKITNPCFDNEGKWYTR